MANHSRFQNFIILFALLFVLVLVFAGCYPEQAKDSIHLEGDSVTFNTYWDTGVVGIHTSGEFAPGSSADYSPWGEAAADRVPKKVAEGKVDTLIWALGLNDISKDRSGWTSEDEDTWSNLLVGQIPETSCVVLVLPWVLDFYGRPIEEMEEMRQWTRDLAAAHPNMVVVDWKPVLEEHPEYSATDGVHIDRGTGGAEARDALYRQGVSQCL